MNKENESIKNQLKELSTEFNKKYTDTAVILAAGHGKRIKSHTSKMLHKIWGVSTVERVFSACRAGLGESNSIVVVGIKAGQVAETIGKREHTLFAYQAEQNGTGHAVKTGLDVFDAKNYEGAVYVFPGDMGLIDAETVKMFKDKFSASDADMMVLTGQYEGRAEENSYGRIIRVKPEDTEGIPSGKNLGKVIEILEHKDILALDDKIPYKVVFDGREYSFTKKELIENREFNSGVYAFKSKHLSRLVNEISSDNAQGEIYITDLIAIFNRRGLTVDAVSPEKQYVIMGFNNKSVLKQMESIARKIHYEKLKDIIQIEDPDDFFIDETIIEEILEADSAGTPLDIQIDKGAHIGKGVKLNFNLSLKKNVSVQGNVVFGKNITVWENAHLSCYSGQKLIVGDNSEILWGNIIKGNIEIGENCRIESSVNMTGSDDYPTKIGNNVVIKGTSYIFGSIIDDDMFIEHSVLIKKKLTKLAADDREIKEVKFYLPMPEGMDTITDLKR